MEIRTLSLFLLCFETIQHLFSFSDEASHPIYSMDSTDCSLVDTSIQCLLVTSVHLLQLGLLRGNTHQNN